MDSGLCDINQIKIENLPVNLPVNWVAQAGFSVVKVVEEMVEDNVGNNSDTNLTATIHHVLQVFLASPVVTNSIANWSKRCDVSIIPEICARIISGKI